MTRRAVIVDEPERDTVAIYVGDETHSYELGQPEQYVVTPGDQRRPFVRLDRWAYELIRDAIVVKSEGVLAERGTLAADVADARETRDRLLDLVETLVNQ